MRRIETTWVGMAGDIVGVVIVVMVSQWITGSAFATMTGLGVYIILRMHSNLSAARAEQESSNEA